MSFNFDSLVLTKNAHIECAGFLSKEAPFGRVSIISSQKTNVFARPFSKEAQKNGNRIDSVILPSGLRGTAEELAFLEKYFFEDTRAAIAIGGGSLINLVKVYAELKEVPLIVVPTVASSVSLLLPYSRLYKGGNTFLFESKRPCALFCDENIIKHTRTDLNLSGLASVAAAGLSIFDIEQNANMGGKKFEWERSIIFSCVQEAGSLIDKIMRGEANAKIKLAELVFMCSGALSNLNFVPAHLSMAQALNKVSGRVLPCGYGELLCAHVLTRLYRVFLDFDGNFLSLCAAHERGKFVNIFLGQGAQARMLKDLDKTKNLIYNTLQHRKQLLNTALAINKLLTPFASLIKIAGTHFDSKEISVSLALAPEFCESRSLLKIFRNLGLTDFAYKNAF